MDDKQTTRHLPALLLTEHGCWVNCAIFATLLLLSVIPSDTSSISADSVLTTAPGSPCANNIIDGYTAEISWSPVPADSVRGNFEGYKIRVLPEGEDTTRVVRVGPNDTSSIIHVLKPDSMNAIDVSAYNGQYDGPPSDKLIIHTPEMPPGPIFVKAYPMGPHALFVDWKPPTEPNGILTHYEMEVAGKELNFFTQLITYLPSVKLTRLEPDTKYRITVYAVNSKWYGPGSIVETATEPNRTSEAMELLPVPGPPQFLIAGKTNDSIVILWHPQAAAEKGHRTGEDFYVQYKVVNDTEWKKTDIVTDSVQTEVSGLEPGTNYSFRVVAVEGNKEVPLDKRKLWKSEKWLLLLPDCILED